tara:strand:- start:63 stop:548 length:486 start_codon:yes stop_codon:yes gene_type:complete
MSKWMICRTWGSSGDGYSNVGCDFALLRVTADLLVKLADLQAVGSELAAKQKSFCSFTCWDSEPYYLDDVPEEWDEWTDELESGVWEELPFDPKLGEATDEQDGKSIKLGRTEIDRIHVSRRVIYWSATVKHTAVKIETAPFRDTFSPTEKLALCCEQEAP